MRAWVAVLVVAACVALGLALRPAPARQVFREVPARPAGVNKMSETVRFLDEDNGQLATPVKKSKPLPVAAQFGGTPVDETNRLPVHGQPAEWTVVDSAASGAAKTLTKAGEVGKCHYITGFDVAFGGAVADGRLLQLRDDTTVKWHTVTDVTGSVTAVSRVHVQFQHPIKMTTGKDASLVLAIATGAVTSYLSLSGYTR